MISDSSKQIMENGLSHIDVENYMSTNDVATCEHRLPPSQSDSVDQKQKQQMDVPDVKLSILQDNKTSGCSLSHVDRNHDTENMVPLCLTKAETNDEILSGISDYGSSEFLYDEGNLEDKEGIKGRKRRNMLFSRPNKNHTANLDEQRKIEMQLAVREDKLIRKMKIIFFLVLVMIGILISYYVFHFLQNEEINEFNTQFRNYGQLIINKLHTNALSKIEAINTLALYIQSYALQNNLTWPYVTVPHFEDHVIAMRALTDAYGVQLFPVVTNETRTTWEEYSVKNNYWINESYRTQMGYFGNANNAILGDNASWFDALWTEDYANPEMPNFDIANGMSSTIFVTKHPDNESNWDPYVDPDTIGPYFPQWQSSPMSWYYQTTVNLDYGTYSDFHNCSLISMNTFEACLGFVWTDQNAPGYISTMMYPIFDQFVYKYNSDLDSTTISSDGNGRTVDDGNETQKRKVVAFLGVDIYWESYLKGILPPTAKKNHVVVKSTCDDLFTFEMKGENVTFLDKGDLHEARYDNMFQTTRFGEELYRTALEGSQQIDNKDITSRSLYVGQPLHDEFCQYDFTIYPSSDLENSCKTIKPMVYTLSVVALFVFTFIVFIGYDWLVEKRQRIVLKSAILSDSIVSSLFPKNVKQQLYHDRTANTKEEQGKQQLTDSSARSTSGSSHPHSPAVGFFDKLRIFGLVSQPLVNHNVSIGSTFQSSATPPDKLTTNDNVPIDSVCENNDNNSKMIDGVAQPIDRDHLNESGRANLNEDRMDATDFDNHGVDTLSRLSETICSSSRGSRKTQSTFGKNGNGIIANFYPEATVLFADIAGFTSWCSGREPSDVFLLLETIYGAFDVIAVRRKVFKVETIGDCYVAVTGVPEAQPDHAVIMVKFAHDMLTQLREELKHISHALGSDSYQLAMRVGINSGPVIAGVLRGDRARFQLFGDTMNTAARMESNGERDRIHVSQTTAEFLTIKGKGHWLTARSNMIEAKGKGKLQTYWVNMRPSTLAFRTDATNAELPSTNPMTD